METLVPVQPGAGPLYQGRHPNAVASCTSQTIATTSAGAESRQMPRLETSPASSIPQLYLPRQEQVPSPPSTKASSGQQRSTKRAISKSSHSQDKRVALEMVCSPCRSASLCPRTPSRRFCPALHITKMRNFASHKALATILNQVEGGQNEEKIPVNSNLHDASSQLPNS